MNHPVLKEVLKMSNETNVLLQSILDMDRQERLRTQEAEEYRGKAMAKLEDERKEIHNKHQQQAQEQIETYIQQENQREKDALQQLQQKSAAVKQNLETASSAKKQEWVDNIFARVLER